MKAPFNCQKLVPAQLLRFTKQKRSSEPVDGIFIFLLDPLEDVNVVSAFCPPANERYPSFVTANLVVPEAEPEIILPELS